MKQRNDTANPPIPSDEELEKFWFGKVDMQHARKCKRMGLVDA